MNETKSKLTKDISKTVLKKDFIYGRSKKIGEESKNIRSEKQLPK